MINNVGEEVTIPDTPLKKYFEDGEFIGTMNLKKTEEFAESLLKALQAQ